MPVRTFRKKLHPHVSDLVDRLAAEWKAKKSKAAQPIILEEKGRGPSPTHIYVIWDDWADLSQVERSEIILDAFEKRYGFDKDFNVTVAMGLLPVEADRLGIEYREK